MRKNESNKNRKRGTSWTDQSVDLEVNGVVFVDCGCVRGPPTTTGDFWVDSLYIRFITFLFILNDKNSNNSNNYLIF